MKIDTVMRVLKRERGFLLIDKTCVNDDRISWKAKGLHTYLMGKPDDWIIMREDLINRGTDGRESVQSGMQELRDFGYAALITMQDTDGAILGKRWVIAETPTVLAERLGTVERESRPTVDLAHFGTVGRVSRQTVNPLDGKPAATKNEYNKEGTITNIEPELFNSIPETPKKESKDAEASRRREQAERIYFEYPKKIKKLAAITEIEKALKGYEYVYLFSQVQSYAICRMGKDPTYTPAADKWFKDGCYMDDEAQWTSNPAGLAKIKPELPKVMSSEQRRNARRNAA